LGEKYGAGTRAKEKGGAAIQMKGRILGDGTCDQRKEKRGMPVAWRRKGGGNGGVVRARKTGV